jgi:hypothetical protein
MFYYSPLLEIHPNAVDNLFPMSQSKGLPIIAVDSLTTRTSISNPIIINWQSFGSILLSLAIFCLHMYSYGKLAWLNSILRERVTLHIKNSASYFAIVFARRGKKKILTFPLYSESAVSSHESLVAATDGLPLLAPIISQ